MLPHFDPAPLCSFPRRALPHPLTENSTTPNSLAQALSTRALAASSRCRCAPCPPGLPSDLARTGAPPRSPSPDPHGWPARPPTCRSGTPPPPPRPASVRAAEGSRVAGSQRRDDTGAARPLQVCMRFLPCTQTLTPWAPKHTTWYGSRHAIPASLPGQPFSAGPSCAASCPSLQNRRPRNSY